MGDEDHRQAALDQLLHPFAKFLRALRRQHGGGLIEDQHLAVAEKGAGDFNLLLLTERKFAGDGIEWQGERKFAFQFFHARRNSGAVRTLVPGSTEGEIFENGQRRDQHGVLENGADPRIETGRRARQPRLLAVEREVTFIGLLETGENAHERGLAGTVLAQKNVHLTGMKCQRHVVDRNHAREALGHSVHTDDACPRFRGQVVHFFRCYSHGASHSATVTRARTSSASNLGSTLMSPAMICSRRSITSFHAFSSTCGVLMSLTELSARLIE